MGVMRSVEMVCGVGGGGGVADGGNRGQAQDQLPGAMVSAGSQGASILSLTLSQGQEEAEVGVGGN